MNFNEYQIKAKSTDIYSEKYAFFCHVLGLAGEAGEVVDKVKKIYRDNNGNFTDVKKIEIAYELGDALWYIACIAYDLEISLDDIAFWNINKLAGRKERNKLNGSGDHR